MMSGRKAFQLARGSVPLLLIRPDQLGVRQHVSHRLLEPRLGHSAEIRQDSVERVELVKVAVAADRRARSL